MYKFSKFTHEKTSSSKEGRLNHFQRLKGKHTQSSFILVGPHNHSYLGGVAVEFQPLSYQKKQVLDCQTPKTQTGQNPNQKTRANEGSGNKTSFFNGVIANAPINRQTGEVIQLSDSPSPEPYEGLLSALPLLSVYNSDKKYYTPTFIFPNANVRDEDCKTNFNTKIDEAKREIDADQIMEPRPRNKHLYCGVCKEPFEEYLGHVRGKTHQDKSRKSPFAHHIKNLELQMNIGSNKKEREKEWKRIKAKEDRLRRKEEGQDKKGKPEGEENNKRGHSQEGEKQENETTTKNKDQTPECKVQAKIEAREETDSVRKQRKQRKLRGSKKSKSTSTRQRQRSSSSSQNSSSSSSSSSSRSRQKKPRKKRVPKEKKPPAQRIEQVKRKRGRPSKKDLEERRLNELLSQSKRKHE